jgi:hypothetical protein
VIVHEFPSKFFGAKAPILFDDFSGTAKAVPFQTSSLAARLKAAPIQSKSINALPWLVSRLN